MGKAIHWILRIAIAIILLQTLYFKFTGAEESVWIFEALGMEPWGRIMTGVLELIASILLLLSRQAWIGALMAWFIMAGALISHILFLGIEIMGDGGLLFVLALVVFVSSSILLWMDRHTFPLLLIRWMKLIKMVK